MNAAENAVTLKPRTIVPKYQNTIPFTNNEKNPRVNTFIGRVRILMIGLRNILNRVKHAPTIRATHIGSTVTPDIN